MRELMYFPSINIGVSLDGDVEHWVFGYRDIVNLIESLGNKAGDLVLLMYHSTLLQPFLTFVTVFRDLVHRVGRGVD